MANILWACWDGGGNLTPSIGIAEGADQLPITRLLDEWGAGRALPADADAKKTRAAAEEILSNPTFRVEAQRRALAFGDLDGAALAADSVDAVLARPTNPRCP